MIFSEESSASGIILEYPAIIPLLNRLGIFLGVGNRSLGELASDSSINPRFLTAMVNTYLNKDFFPEEELREFPVCQLADYLVKTNRYYSSVLLSNVSRHFRSFALNERFGNAYLKNLYDFFLKLQQEMAAEFDRENSIYVRLADMDSDASRISEEERTAILEFAENHDHIVADKLDDLITLLVKHLKGEYDANLCHAVITSLSALENDIRQNHRIRDFILSPLISEIYG